LVARRLCPVRRWVVGAPAYFARHGTPQRPRDLERHACLGYSHLATGGRWHFTNAEGVEEVVTVKGPLSATNAEALEAALLAGIGIALQPDFLAWEALRAGRLVAVLVGWNPAPSALNVLMPRGRPRASRVTVLLDFLIRNFAAGVAPWTAGLPVAA
jgi:DNA-binding transcriptional LysR family regulator